MDNQNRNITLKDFIQAVLVVIYLLAALAVFFLYSKTIGIILLIISFWFVGREFSKLPLESKKKIEQELEKQDKSIFSKAFKILGVIFIGYLIYALIASSIN